MRPDVETTAGRKARRISCAASRPDLMMMMFITIIARDYMRLHETPQPLA